MCYRFTLGETLKPCHTTSRSFYSISAAEIKPAVLRLSLHCLPQTQGFSCSTHHRLHMSREWKRLFPLISSLHHPALTDTFLIRCCCNVLLLPVCWNTLWLQLFPYQWFKHISICNYLFVFVCVKYKTNAGLYLQAQPNKVLCSLSPFINCAEQCGVIPGL